MIRLSMRRKRMTVGDNEPDITVGACLRKVLSFDVGLHRASTQKKWQTQVFFFTYFLRIFQNMDFPLFFAVCGSQYYFFSPGTDLAHSYSPLSPGNNDIIAH